MLSVKTPNEVIDIINGRFHTLSAAETIPASSACGRVSAEDILCGEYIPDFDRSSMDGYAVRAADTFGCSDSLPAMLALDPAVRMGGPAEAPLSRGACAPVPTGGALPDGADAVVMQEYSESYGDGTVGILRAAAPGENVVFRGDDAAPGSVIVRAGQVITAADIGAVCAAGTTSVRVIKRPLAGILSTGNELVPPDRAPAAGQVRDVNSAMLAAQCLACGASILPHAIIPDDEKALTSALENALSVCDAVLISGGSSVGQHDLTEKLLKNRGEPLFHGIAMKPGKPTLLADIGGKPVWGLPGHPAAAFFVCELFIRPLIFRLAGIPARERKTLRAVLTAPLSANHGRAQYTGVKLRSGRGLPLAEPVHGKSGLIFSLAKADGYVCVPRDREGFPAGETVPVTLLRSETEALG